MKFAFYEPPGDLLTAEEWTVAAGDARSFGADRTGWTGSSSVAVGALPSRAVRYAATLEPFHDNTVAVYVDPDGPDV